MSGEGRQRAESGVCLLRGGAGPALLDRFRAFNRTGWRFFGVFLPWKRSVGRLDPARDIDRKRKRILTPSNIFLHLNIGDPASLFVTNKIQASIYPIHCNAILLAVGAMSAIFAKKPKRKAPAPRRSYPELLGKRST